MEEQIPPAKIPWYKYRKMKYDGKLLAFWQFLAATIVIFFAGYLMVDSFVTGFDGGFMSDESSDSNNESACNVMGMNLHGEVVTYVAPENEGSDGYSTLDETEMAVAENRKLDIKKVAALADGSTMMGEMALKNGLIDAIGGYPEAKQYLTDTIGEKAEICWY